MFTQALSKIISKKDLTNEEISKVMLEIFSGSLTDAQIGAFMAALATKGETFEELAGAAGAMRQKAARIQAAAPVIVDTCGTG
ncbi:MAG: anthranilate phosphoribosyltransferase, partial [bacterium]|nr:anthranilate phosphoribosyltransferase [bacterium]